MMNWEAISAVGEIVGSIAVVITLAYLALQTRQNSKHTKSLLQQGQTNRVTTLLLSLATPDLANVWITGNGGAATEESVKHLQFAQVCDMIVYDMMDFHHTHSDGLTSDEQFGSACVAYSNILQQSGMHAFWTTWKEARTQKCPEFIAWVDDLASGFKAEGNRPWA